jgi:hypothetical protein
VTLRTFLGASLSGGRSAQAVRDGDDPAPSVLQVGHEEVRDPGQQGHLAKDRAVEMRLRHGRGELELEAMPQVRHVPPELTAQLHHFLPERADRDFAGQLPSSAYSNTDEERRSAA